MHLPFVVSEILVYCISSDKSTKAHNSKANPRLDDWYWAFTGQSEKQDVDLSLKLFCKYLLFFIKTPIYQDIP